jgi:hypothetical protein
MISDKLKPNDFLMTPEWVYRPLGIVDLDAWAGIDTSIGMENYRGVLGQDGLSLPWSGFVFCNPPFSEKELWIEKMKAHGDGILLLPERGSTPWHGPLADFCKYHFTLGKKINFAGGSSSNPTGTTLFLFGESAIQRIKCSGLPGTLNKVERFRPRRAY